MSGNELPKVIDKSQADIDAAIETIKASDIPAGTKDFAISCIKLAVWLPKALLEHKIKLSNLRKLIVADFLYEARFLNKIVVINLQFLLNLTPPLFPQLKAGW